MITLTTTNVTDAIQAQYRYGNTPNAIVDYIVSDFIESGSYSSVEALITDLEMAHCAAGSFSGMIYTHDILDKLSDPAWRDAIEIALDSYRDATGESPRFDIDCLGHQDTFRLENVVTFAVDWMANEIASFLRCLGKFYIVKECIYYTDPKPECVVFLDEWEAEEFSSDRIQARVEYVVAHSQETISQEQLDSITEQESSLFSIEVESVQ